jgi:predicted negative regulator of RcsB-dependent stress response
MPRFVGRRIPAVSQHISRKELKKDEIRETLAHGAEAVISHSRLAGILITVGVAVALAIVGWRFYSERQTAKAAAALDEAMKTYDARIRAPGEPAEPTEVTYVEEKNKYEDAVKKLGQVAKEYPRTRPGQQAGYYAALSQEHLGRLDEAQKAFQAIADSGSEELAALARFQIAQIDEKNGKSDDAVKLYRQLIDKPTLFLPKPLAMLALADHFSKTNPAEATKLYNDIKREFPDSAASDQADKRLALLTPQS